MEFAVTVRDGVVSEASFPSTFLSCCTTSSSVTFGSVNWKSSTLLQQEAIYFVWIKSQD